MDYLVKTFPDGTKVQIDMDPVNDYIRMIRGSLLDRYPSSDEPLEELRILKGLEKNQLEFVVVELAGMLRSQAGRANYLCSKAGVKKLQELHELRDQAIASGEDLWSEIG